MEIKCVKDGGELDSVMNFVKREFSKINIDYPQKPHDYDFYLEKENEKSDLLLYAAEENAIIASIFAYEENNNITMGHVCVDENYRNKGIGKILMDEAENRIKRAGYKLITLGSVETAEGFYENMGYKGSLLIQSEINTIEELLSLNINYEVAWTNIYDEKINQVCLSLEKPDRELQKKYKEVFPDSYSQMIFQKILE